MLIASNVQIYTASHPVLPEERLVFENTQGQETFFKTFARPLEIHAGSYVILILKILQNQRSSVPWRR